VLVCRASVLRYRGWIAHTLAMPIGPPVSAMARVNACVSGTDVDVVEAVRALSQSTTEYAPGIGRESDEALSVSRTSHELPAIVMPAQGRQYAEKVRTYQVSASRCARSTANQSQELAKGNTNGAWCSSRNVVRRFVRCRPLNPFPLSQETAIDLYLA